MGTGRDRDRKETENLEKKKLICNDLLSRENLQGVTTNLFNCFGRHLERASGYQFPALATLIYVDWLPTGQWSAVSSTV